MNSTKSKVIKIFITINLFYCLSYIVGIYFGSNELLKLERSNRGQKISTIVAEYKEHLQTDLILNQMDSLNTHALLLKEAIQSVVQDDGVCLTIYKTRSETAFNDCNGESNLSSSISFEIDTLSLKPSSIQVYLPPSKNPLEVLLLSLPSLMVIISGSILINLFIFKKTIKDIIRPLTNAARSEARSMAVTQTIEMLAHDLRRPFSHINILLDRISSAAHFDEVKSIVDKYHGGIKQSIQSINTSLNTVLPNAKKEQDLVCDIKEVAEKVISRLKLICDLPKKDLRIDLPKNCKANISNNSLERVIENILLNAVEASPHTAVIKLSCHKERSLLKLKIWNSGSFIEPKNLDKIFDPYYTDKKPFGTGLGLTTAKQILSSYNATIDCQNFDNGVLFTISIPSLSHPEDPTRKGHAEAHANTRHPEARRAEGSPSNITILILEDEVIYQDELARQIKQLSSSSFKIDPITVDTHEEALSQIMIKKPDILIIDLYLNDKSISDSLLFIQLIQKAFPEIYIAVHSNAVNIAPELNLNLYPKPISTTDLTQIVFHRNLIRDTRLINK